MPNINTAFVNSVQPPATGYKIHWDQKLSGYGVRVNAKGTKSFVAQGRCKGVSVLFTIGPFGKFTEYEARAEAKLILQGMCLGKDPRDMRRRAEGMTLRQLADEYVSRSHRKMKERSRHAVLRQVDTTWGEARDKPLGWITENWVRSRYERMLKGGLHGNREGGSPGAAKQAFAVLHALLQYAVDEQKGITANPAAKVVNRHNRVKLKPRETFIQQSRIGGIWNWLAEMRAQSYTQGAMNRYDLARWLLWTGCRVHEALELTWDRVNLDEEDPWWHLPGSKNSGDYWIPMSRQALEMMKIRRREIPRHVSWVFPSYRSKNGHMEDPRDPLWEPISEMAGERIRAHDCRRSMMNYGLMDCRIEKFRIDLLTTHKLGGVVEQHYIKFATQRLQWLRPEVQQISDWLDQKGVIAAGKNVIELNARKAG